ncbi:MAG: ribosomal L7Ae/L30e/S12e/Gadd45 family protein [Thermovirgaceae bacterium]
MNELAVSSRLVGTKKLVRALKAGKVSKVFLARDAETALTAPIEREAVAAGISVEWVSSRQSLGRACCIDRPAAVAGIGTEPAGQDEKQ